MKIYNNVNKVIDLYIKNTPTEKTSNRINDLKKDEVSISKEVRDISRYIDSALNSETANEKVEAIRQKIMNKEYKIDSRKLAEAILLEIYRSGDV